MSREKFEEQKYTYEDILEAVKYGINYGADEEDEELNVPEGNVQQWLEATKLRTAEQWQTLFPDIVVIDPDGWRDAESHKRAWYEDLITYQEYMHRRDQSTCQFKKKEEV